KRFAEIDFLICSTAGLFVIEVKGGAVACEKGRWSFTDRYGSANTSFEGPFKQAEGALVGLTKLLRERLPNSPLHQLVVGYGVILPDCNWSSECGEWDAPMMLDQRRLNSLASWLDALVEYWRGRNQQGKIAEPATV